MRKKNILKAAGVLLIVTALVFSSVVVANTKTQSQLTLGTTSYGSGTGARDDIVWDNDMEYAGLGAAQLDEQYPFEAECADDFHFEEDTIVCDVHWIGGYWQTGYAAAHWPWEITFYYDDGTGERPGGIFIGPLVFDVGEYTETFITDTGTSIYYEFSVDLPENYVFPACYKFWISIRGIGIFPPQSGWGIHPGILLHSMVFRSALLGYPVWTDSYDVWGEDRDMCFQLTTKPTNVPPEPPEITGPSTGKAGEELCWKFHAYDNDSEMVRYHIDWGDGTSTTTDWVEVCTWIEVCHTYTEKGTYIIKVYAEDDSGLISAETQFTIVITTAKAVNYQFFQQFLGRLINAFPMLKYLLGF